jgi:uncharacterized membrane protein YfcA
MLELFLLSMLIGVVAGILAGLFGLGGGVVIVPALYGLFSVQQFPNEYIMIMAVATSLATIILTSVSSVMAHNKLGTIIWCTVFRLTPGILFGAGMGAVLADLLIDEMLKWFFISYLIYVGIRMATQASSMGNEEKTNHWLDYLVGNGIGFLSSILGIGGGTLTVPYLVSRQVPMKNAVAVSSACGLPIAISGAMVYAWLGWDNTFLPEWSLGYIYLPALAGIVICSVFTAPIGAKLAYKLPARKLKRYFSLVIFLIAIKMILDN